MHEYAITKSLVQMASSKAEEAGSKRIIEIRIVVGQLSTYFDESIQMYFDIISKGTLAEGSKLIFHSVPAEFYCSKCVSNFVKPKNGFECPKCGLSGSPTEIGKEFYIESIEVE